MIKWYKAQNRQVQVMLIVIILLLIGIIVRWNYVTTEVTDAFRHRFTRTNTVGNDTLPDTAAPDTIR